MVGDLGRRGTRRVSGTEDCYCPDARAERLEQGTHNYIEEERLRSVQRTGPWDRGTVVEEQPRTTSRMLLQDLDSNNSL
jgi:hypothetical protein